ncbi:MAG: flagellar basal body-associated FliL family protein [Hyphomonas sp.]|nr:flagellar basal body-associated FliL family protein [Hyphomonas sp.]
MAKKPDKKASAKPEGDPAEPAPKPAGGLMGLLMLGGASLVSSFGLVYLLTPPPSAAIEACVAGDPAALVIAPTAKADQAYVQVKEMIITVGSAPATRYLKMNVSIITTSGNTSAVKDAEPMLIDAFNTYLRSIEMQDFEDPGFYPRMREQLARRSELVLGSGVSKGILITEFLLR